MWRTLSLLCLLACTGEDPSVLPTCAESMASGAALTSLDDVAPLVERVRAERFPELEGVPLTVETLSSEDSFLVADVDVTTVDEPPLERAYRVRANPALFPDPPGFAAMYAIVAHELTHVLDYTGMDTEAFIAFGIRYATGPVAEYERATDEHVLELGCGEGLIAFRRWLYDRVDAETEAEKRRDYYTPEEIEAWMAANDG